MPDRRANTAGLLLLGVFLLLVSAGPLQAAPPDPERPVFEDGYTLLTISIPAPSADVRAVLADPRYTLLLTPSVKEVEILDQGECDHTRSLAKAFFISLRYESRRCPTETGWREELVASEQVRVYSTEWIIEPAEGGTRVQVRVRLQMKVDVPERLIAPTLAGQMKRALRKLAELSSAPKED